MQHTTLKENILFGSYYRSRKYKNIINACALQSDIDNLPDEDLTKIGDNGMNISGGQKQRISIARAIYCGADVVVLVRKLIIFFFLNCYIFILNFT